MESWDNVAENFCKWPSFEYFSKLNLNDKINAIIDIKIDAHLLSCFYHTLNFLSFLVIRMYKINAITLKLTYKPIIIDATTLSTTPVWN